MTEDEMKKVFGEYGPIFRFKKFQNVAFISFEEKADAKRAEDALNLLSLNEEQLNISFLKPMPKQKFTATAKDIGGY
jgi:RNA recognition motif-containing protein